MFLIKVSDHKDLRPLKTALKFGVKIEDLRSKKFSTEKQKKDAKNK